MSLQFTRKKKNFVPARRRPTARHVQLRVEQFEGRITPALFTAQNPAYTFSGLNNNGCVAVADFNKDGRLDAVLTNFGTGYGSPSQPGTTPGNSINILRGNSSGGFNNLNVLTQGENVSFASVGDINNDTWPDLVVTNQNRQNGGSVSVFQNISGNLSLVGTFSTFSNNPSWVGLADVTSDTILDVIVGSFGTENNNGYGITIFQGNGSKGIGNFTYSGTPIATIAPSVDFVPTALAVADFDGDLRVDIAACVPTAPPDFGEPQGDGRVYIFKGNGSGGFTQLAQIQGQGALPVNIQAADLNGDGRKDLIVANAGDPNMNFSDDSVDVYPNISSVGNPSFGFPETITADCFGPFAVAAADFNMDGDMDIASVNYGSPFGFSPVAFVSVYLGDGSGINFTTETSGGYNTQTSLPGGQYLAVGNFDSNPAPDLIVAHASNLVGLLRNNTAATPVPVVETALVNGTTAAQRSRVTSLTVTFNTQVTFANGNTAGAFTLTRVGGGAVNFQASSTVVGGKTLVTLNSFTGLETEDHLTGVRSLRDGRYTLTALAANVSAGGQQMASNFVFGDAQGLFRLFGDVTGDRRVDGTDFGLFVPTYNLNSSQTGFLSYLDFNGDGRIDSLDFQALVQRYNAPLP